MGRERPRGNVLLEVDGTERELPNKVTMDLAPGQGIRHRMAGAGGHGDPLARDPARVLDDVLDERISAAYARERHGVVVRDGSVDADATTTRRADASRRRRTTDNEEDR